MHRNFHISIRVFLYVSGWIDKFQYEYTFVCNRMMMLLPSQSAICCWISRKNNRHQPYRWSKEKTTQTNRLGKVEKKQPISLKRSECMWQPTDLPAYLLRTHTATVYESHIHRLSMIFSMSCTLIPRCSHLGCAIGIGLNTCTTSLLNNNNSQPFHLRLKKTTFHWKERSLAYKNTLHSSRLFISQLQSVEFKSTEKPKNFNFSAQRKFTKSIRSLFIIIVWFDLRKEEKETTFFRWKESEAI